MLSDQGIARPGIFGLALDGTHGTPRDPRHRRRAVRRRHDVRPRGRADAVHPVDLGDRRGRRRQRRPARPAGHLRRVARLRGLPLLRHRRPRHRRRVGAPRSTATTTASATSTWCWRSCRPTWTATSPSVPNGTTVDRLHRSGHRPAATAVGHQTGHHTRHHGHHHAGTTTTQRPDQRPHVGTDLRSRPTGPTADPDVAPHRRIADVTADTADRASRRACRPTCPRSSPGPRRSRSAWRRG